MMSTKRQKYFVPNAIVLAIIAGLANQAMADDFEVGDGWNGSWGGTASYGSSWRTQNPNTSLYGQQNGKLLGLTNGTGGNTIDEGDLNYSKGQQFSSPFKIIAEVELKKDDMGMLLRGKAWYDYTLINQSVNFGNQPNGYNGYNLATNSMTQRNPLSDSGYDKLLRFDGVELLDAYVYDSFDVAGKPLQVRLGNEVLNWGESLFIQGVNQINPIDVPSYRKPGAELKEVFIPIPMVSASQSLGEYGTLEAFYQFKFEPTPIEAGCGNYWAVANGNISVNPGACNNAVTLSQSNPYGLASGLYVPTIQGKDPGSKAEFGVAYHMNADAIDTELGFYAMEIDPRIPSLSVHFGNYTNVGSYSPIAASWDYAAPMKVFGTSAATNLLGWSVAAELGVTQNYPAQLDGNDLLYAGLGAAGAITGSRIPFGPLGKMALAAINGNGVLNGETSTTKTQLNLNAVKAGNGILNAAQYVLVGEVGFQKNTLPDNAENPDSLRYNRAFIFGPGSSAGYGGSTCGTLNTTPSGCHDSGYVTPFAWGYRVKGELTYNNTFVDGLTTQPSVFFAQDVNGYSVDGQFLQDRMTLGLGSRFTYNKKYSVELASVFYNRSATYDPLSDRAYFSVNFKASF